MAETGTDYHSTTLYPVFASKLDFMRAVNEELYGAKPNRDRLFELMNRFGNTDTSTFADPTLKWDDSTVQSA